MNLHWSAGLALTLLLTAQAFGGAYFRAANILYDPKCAQVFDPNFLMEARLTDEGFELLYGINPPSPEEIDQLRTELLSKDRQRQRGNLGKDKHEYIYEVAPHLSLSDEALLAQGDIKIRYLLPHIAPFKANAKPLLPFLSYIRGMVHQVNQRLIPGEGPLIVESATIRILDYPDTTEEDPYRIHFHIDGGYMTLAVAPDGPATFLIKDQVPIPLPRQVPLAPTCQQRQFRYPRRLLTTPHGRPMCELRRVAVIVRLKPVNFVAE